MKCRTGPIGGSLSPDMPALPKTSVVFLTEEAIILLFVFLLSFGRLFFFHGFRRFFL